MPRTTLVVLLCDEEACEAFRRVLAADPVTPWPTHNLADTLSEMGYDHDAGVI